MLKNYLVFMTLTFLCFKISVAQNINTTIKDLTNLKFSLLEKDRIPNDILIDYGYEFIDISNYDGVLRTDNYLSIARYNELYNTIVSSATTTGISGIFDPTQERTEWRDLHNDAQRAYYTIESETKVILSGLFYSYNRINPTALFNNKIEIQFQRYKDKYINEKWQNPYLYDRTFAITAPIKTLTAPTVTVQMPITLWHSNVNASHIQIDFGDGTGYHDIKNGQAATTTYTRSGEYTWTYKFSSNISRTSFYSHQKVKVDIPDAPRSRISACGGMIQNITASRSYLGEFGSATVEVLYGGNNCNEIDNPLIIVEGLDTGLLAAGGSIGDSDLRNFISSVEAGSSNVLDELIIDDSTVDFDLIYVNWDNGTDYLQRNAYVLQEVIDWVNQIKVGNTQNVVLGQSMGGVISRYALKDMEDNNENSDTRLYVSHDSPHQGAHVPLGLLYMVRQFIDQFIETPLGGISIPLENSELGLGSIEDLLDAPAVNQLLKNSINSQLNLDNGLHNSWQSELEAIGYPQNTRNIALSNASHCASPQGLTSNQELLSVQGDGSTSLLVDLFQIIVPLYGPLSGLAPGIVFDDIMTAILGTLPGSSKLEVDIEVNAYPSFGSAEVYDGRLTYEKTLLWLLPIRTNIFNDNFNSPSGVLFQDDFPGGVSPFNEGFDANIFTSNILGSFGVTASAEPTFGFISAASALDVGSGNTNLDDSDFRNIYTAQDPPSGSRAIPFDNFTTSYNVANNNEPHITFNERNGDWLASELNLLVNTEVFDCSFICGGGAIEGSDYICDQTLFFIDADPNDITTTWQIIGDQNAVNIISSNNTELVVQAVGGYRENISIRATIASTECDATVVIERNDLRVGAPGLPSSLTGPDEVETGALVDYSAGIAEGASSYKWRLPHPFLTVSQFNYNGDQWQLRSAGGDTRYPTIYSGMGEIDGLVQVSGVNPCGEGGARMLSVTHETGGGGGIPTPPPGINGIISAYPNPATSTVHLTINQTEKNTAEIQNIKIFDRLMQEQQLSDFGDGRKQSELDVSILRRGIYFIQVTTNEGVEIIKLLVD